MPALVDDSLEADVPMQALQALREAQARTRQSGRPQVLVVGRNLVRIVNGQETILKVLPARRKIIRRPSVEPV